MTESNRYNLINDSNSTDLKEEVECLKQCLNRTLEARDAALSLYHRADKKLLKMGYVLQDLMNAHEREIKSLCENEEVLNGNQWKCKEYLEARDLIMAEVFCLLEKKGSNSLSLS